MNTDKLLAKSIAKDYAPRTTFKITALKKLDRRAKLPASIFAYTCGVVSTLVLGVGLCLSLHVIGHDTLAMLALGCVLGVLGIVGASVNYPLYKKLLEHGKQKYAFEIMELANEIAAQ